MVTKELRAELEKIPCPLGHGETFVYLSEDKKGNIKLKCSKCAEKGISNVITVTATPKKVA